MINRFPTKTYEFDGKIAIVLCKIVLKQINMYIEKNLILTLYITACKKKQLLGIDLCAKKYSKTSREKKYLHEWDGQRFF